MVALLMDTELYEYARSGIQLCDSTLGPVFGVILRLRLCPLNANIETSVQTVLDGLRNLHTIYIICCKMSDKTAPAR